MVIALADMPQHMRASVLRRLKLAFPGRVARVEGKINETYRFTANHYSHYNQYSTSVSIIFSSTKLNTFLTFPQGEGAPANIEPCRLTRNGIPIKTSAIMPRASKEIQRDSEEYRLLQEIFQEIFEWQRSAV